MVSFDCDADPWADGFDQVDDDYEGYLQSLQKPEAKKDDPAAGDQQQEEKKSEKKEAQQQENVEKDVEDPPEKREQTTPASQPGKDAKKASVLCVCCVIIGAYPGSPLGQFRKENQATFAMRPAWVQGEIVPEGHRSTRQLARNTRTAQYRITSKVFL
jgi:hypothetical protein